MKSLSHILVLICLLGSLGCTSIPSSEKSGEKFAQPQNTNPREVIFIHGMFMTPKCWENWEAYFKAKGYQVSAPPWPLHEGSVQELRQSGRLEALGKLELAQVLDHYRNILRTKSTKPILIGHSMGGLVAQILLSEGLAQAAVTIDSAPPEGVISFEWSFLKSNWGAISPFANIDHPIELDFDSFSYAFLNQEDPASRQKIYDEFYVPESRRVGKGPTMDVAKIDPTRARGPLLLIAGGADHIIPGSLTYKNFKLYNQSPAYTEFKLFRDRDHWTIGAPGWESLANEIDQWLTARFVR